MHISCANIDDLEALAGLFDAYRVFYGQDSDPPRAHAFLNDRLERGESTIFIARLDDGTAAGFTQLYPLFSSVSTGRVWLLNDLYVASSARRTGTGAALLAAAREFARSTGALRIELATAHGNTAAQALYEREGYVVDTEFRRYSLNTKG